MKFQIILNNLQMKILQLMIRLFSLRVKMKPLSNNKMMKQQLQVLNFSQKPLRMIFLVSVRQAQTLRKKQLIPT